MSESDVEEMKDKVLLVQVLLEHEKRLKQIEDELRGIREYLTDVDALREHLSEWLVLTESGVGLERRRAAEARPSYGNVTSFHRLLKKLREIEHRRKRGLNDNR